MSVSAETMLDSHRVCLVSPETVKGLQGALFVSTETCFQEVARGTLATLTFLCLRTCKGFVLPSERSCSNLFWSKWMTNVSAIDLRIWSSHCDTWFSAVENAFPSGVTVLFSIENCYSWENLQKEIEKRNYKYFFTARKSKLQVDLLWDFWESVPVESDQRATTLSR